MQRSNMLFFIIFYWINLFSNQIVKFFKDNIFYLISYILLKSFILLIIKSSTHYNLLNQLILFKKCALYYNYKFNWYFTGMNSATEIFWIQSKVESFDLCLCTNLLPIDVKDRYNFRFSAKKCIQIL